MYVFEHALLNLGKNKGRNILMGVIIFAIIAASVVGFAIHGAAGAAIEETKTALLCTVRVAPARQMVGGAVTAGGERQQPSVSLEQYFSFAQSGFLDGADIKENPRNAAGADAVYYLKRPDMLADFEAELRSMGLPDDYSVRTDESALERMAAPVESLKNLSLTFLLIVLALGAAIMVLLSAIAIRERKYEIGVLRAMGMKKGKVALGLWAETIALTCICFVFGMCAGTALSQPVSDAIMAGQAQSPPSASTSLAERLSDSASLQPETIDVPVGALTALEIFGISVLLASISGIISVSRITKYEPINILTKQA